MAGAIPKSGNVYRLGNEQPIVAWRNASARTANTLSVGMSAMFADATRKLDGSLDKMQRDLGKALDLKLIPASRLRQANLTLAKEAQNAVVNGWRSRLPRNSLPYRSGARLTGKLGPALASPAMLEGTTANRISFLNGRVLSRSAAHWYRINYGAEGINLSMSAHRAEDFAVSFRGRNIGQLRDQSAPDQKSWIPTLFMWWGGNGMTGQSMFVPLTSVVRENPRGAAAARYSDLGLNVIADRFGPVYQQTFVQYAHTDAGAAKLHDYGIDVTAGLRTRRR